MIADELGGIFGTSCRLWGRGGVLLAMAKALPHSAKAKEASALCPVWVRGNNGNLTTGPVDDEVLDGHLHTIP